MKYCFFIITLLCTFHSFGQTPKIDSLHKALKNAKNDEERIDIYFYLSMNYAHVDTKKQLMYANKTLNLAKKPKDIAESYHVLGIYYQGQSDYIKALSYYRKSLFIKKKHKIKTIIATENNIALISWTLGKYDEAINAFNNILNHAKTLKKRKMRTIFETHTNIGNVYNSMGNYKKVKFHFQKAFNIVKNSQNLELKSVAYHNLAMYYQQKANYPKAVNLYLKSARMKEQIGNKSQLASTYSNLGLVFSKLEHKKKARNYYIKTLKLDEELGYKGGIVNDYVGIGTTYEDNEVGKLKYYKKALDLAKKINYKNELPNIYNNLGMYYYNQEAYEESYEYISQAIEANQEIGSLSILSTSYIQMLKIMYAKKNFEEAEVYYQKAKALIDKTKNTEDLLLLKEYRAILDEKQGNYKEALKNFGKFILMRDSVNNIKKSKQITELETQYETEKKEQALKLEQQKSKTLKAENRNKQIWNYALGIIILAVALIGFLGFRNRQARLKQATINLELKEKTEALQKTELEKQAREITHTKEQITTQVAMLSQKEEIIEVLKNKLDVKEESFALRQQEVLTILNQEKLRLVSDTTYQQNLRKLKQCVENAYPDFFVFLHKHIPTLPPRLQSYVVLHLLGLDKYEIAHVLNVKPDTTDTYKKRVNAQLKKTSFKNINTFLIEYKSLFIS